MPSVSSPQIKAQPSTPTINIANVPSPNSPSNPHNILPSTEPAPTNLDTSLFTFLPDLYLLISRISEFRNVPPGSSNGMSAPGSQADGAQKDASTSNSANNLTQIPSRESQHSARSGSGTGNENPSIEVRDLPAHIYGVRKRIAEAREFVAGIPDVGRTVEEQEEELRELRGKCAGLRGRLAELGGIAGDSRDTVMRGVEGG